MQEYISYDEIKDYASMLEITADKMQTTFTNIIKNIDKLKRAWEGKASDSFNVEIKKVENLLYPIYEELIKAMVFLISVSDGYQGLESDAARRLKTILEAGSFVVFDEESEVMPLFYTPYSVPEETNLTAEELITVEPFITPESEPSTTEVISDTPVYESPKPFEATIPDITPKAPEVPKEEVKPQEAVEKSYNLDEVALDVIRGNYGNNEERKRKLAEAGYDYDTVQDRVNEMLNGG